MLQDKIRSDLKDAMKAKDTVRMTVLRSLITACVNELTATKRTPQDTLTDEEVLAVMRRALKQRREAAEQFSTGNRPELADNEEKEAEVIETYLPQMMSREEIATVVAAKKEALGVTDKSGMGKLIGAVMGELKGKADGGDVKAVVEESFS